MKTFRAGVAATASLVVAAAGLAMSAPVAADDAPQVVINEVESNGGTPGDWVELKNNGTDVADVSGWVFKDNNDSNAYAIPDGTTIPAGGYLVLDEVIGGVGDFAFGLGASDQARVFAADGATLIDSYTWTSHAPVTYGRCPDGVGEFVATTVATKGAANDCGTPPPAEEPAELSTEIAINEVESNGGTPGDWVEIINLSDTPVDISGWTMKDDNDSRTDTVADGTIVAPGALLVLEEITGPTTEGFSFGLGGNDAFRLYDTEGTLRAAYSWETHARVTYARCPDGTGAWIDAPLSTKGEPNDCTPPVRINEIESSDAAGGPDWIELINIGTEPVDVSGLVLKDDNDSRDFAIADGTVIPTGEFLLLEEYDASTNPGGDFPFGLGGNDEVRLFDTDGTTLIDSYAWTSHAATTYGRCPDGTGSWETTASATPGEPNHCAGVVQASAWPGGAEVEAIDQAGTYAGDLSGVAYEPSGTDAPGTLWAVENGNGLLYRIVPDAHGGWSPTSGWESGRVLRYPDGTGIVDAEGVAVVDGAVYVASERNNAASSISRPSVLRYPVAGSGDLVASDEWNLAPDFPGLGANQGLEGVTWIPDAVLTQAGFVDEATGATYRPADYPGHGGGLFVVAVEGTASAYAYALLPDGQFQRVASIGTTAVGFVLVADVLWDGDREQLWIVCDDACDGRIAAYELVDGAFVATALYERPAGMANLANEGFAIADATQCVDGSVPTFYADDNNTGGHSLRSGTLDCEPGAGGGDDGSGDPDGGSDTIRCTVTAPASAARGDRITLSAGLDCADVAVDVWMFSEPTFLGTRTVAADGTLQVTLPADAAPGTHTLELRLADGTVVGSTSIEVTAAASGTGQDFLSDTGAAGSWLLLLGAAMVIAGAGLVTIRRRSHA